MPLDEDQARALFEMSDLDGSGSIDGQEAKLLFDRLKIMFPQIDHDPEEVFEVRRQRAVAQSGITQKNIVAAKIASSAAPNREDQISSVQGAAPAPALAAHAQYSTTPQKRTMA